MSFLVTLTTENNETVFSSFTQEVLKTPNGKDDMETTAHVILERARDNWKNKLRHEIVSATALVIS